MSLSDSTNSERALRVRGVPSAGRHYLGNRRTLLAIVVVTAAAGLAFNWNWLVAVGLAPILLGTLPCLVACAFGVCMMCRSDKEKAISREAGIQGTSLLSSDANALQPVAACCHQMGRDAVSRDGHQSLSDAAGPSRSDQPTDQRPV